MAAISVHVSWASHHRCLKLQRPHRYATIARNLKRINRRFFRHPNTKGTGLKKRREPGLFQVAKTPLPDEIGSIRIKKPRKHPVIMTHEQAAAFISMLTTDLQLVAKRLTRIPFASRRSL